MGLQEMIRVGLGGVSKGCVGGQHKSRVIDRVIGNDGDISTGQAWVRSRL